MFGASFSMGGPGMMGGFPGMGGMGGMMGMGGFPGGMGMQNPQQMMMMQLMQILQMLMMLMGGGQGMGGPGMGGGCPGIGQGIGDGMGFPGGMGGGGGCGCARGTPFGGGYPVGGNGGGGGNWGGGGMGGAENIQGSAPYNPVTGNRLADTALGMNGRAFKPGQTKRCADFVSTMVERSGQAPPGFRHQESAAGLANYGRAVGKGDLKPGDMVFFGNTYRPGKYTHVGIYAGNGKFVHRPTANKPVRVDSLNQGYYAQHYTAGRRLGV